MKKHAAVFLVFLILALNTIPVMACATASRNITLEDNMAADLRKLGLFRGVSRNDFDLDREPTRIEALVMLIRILGKEDDALNGTWKHPFKDVPGWADKYVGYAYEHKLTKGSSATKYGLGKANAAMYLTCMLRALGYSDNRNADFSWKDPFLLAMSVGIIPACADMVSFWRADVVSISYAALPVCLKNSDKTLADRLIADGVFSKALYDSVYDEHIFDAGNYKNNNVSYSEAGSKMRTLHYEWDCMDWTWSYDFRIPSDDFNFYRSIERNPYAYYSGYSEYVDYPGDDKYIRDLANVFINTAKNNGLDDRKAVDLAISFVQSLEYQSDDIKYGYDYPKYPIETLYDQGGDCEDTSILLVSLLKEMGYRCSLILFNDHMGVGILGNDNMNGKYFELNGKKYFYIETTSKNWNIGDIPDELGAKRASIWVFDTYQNRMVMNGD